MAVTDEAAIHKSADSMRQTRSFKRHSPAANHGQGETCPAGRDTGAELRPPWKFRSVSGLFVSLPAGTSPVHAASR